MVRRSSNHIAGLVDLVAKGVLINNLGDVEKENGEVVGINLSSLKWILNLKEVNKYKQLKQLNISGTGVRDLTPLVQLTELKRVTANTCSLLHGITELLQNKVELEFD